MHVRAYTPADLEALHRIHARQGFDYAFPNLADPIFISKLVIDDDAGHPVCASLARITCETYLLADPDAGTPRERYARLLTLHEAGRKDLLARGLDDAHAWLPPPVASDAASKHSAGSATTRGRHTAAASAKNNSRCRLYRRRSRFSVA